MHDPKSEKATLRLVSDQDTPSISNAESAELIDGLIAEYRCGTESRPEWCIWGKNEKGEKAVLYWIRPSQESDLVARRIAKHMKSQEFDVGVEMTEWNPNLAGKPFYRQAA